MYTKILRNSHRRNDLEVTKRGGTHGYPVSARLGYSIRWKKEMKKARGNEKKTPRKYIQNVQYGFHKFCGTVSKCAIGLQKFRGSFGDMAVAMKKSGLQRFNHVLQCWRPGLAWPGRAHEEIWCEHTA